jgi:hypothetical protein
VAEVAEAGSDALAYAASLGYEVSVAQLARWRRAGLLPRPRQQSLGRGRGTASVYPAGTTAQLVALCQMRAEERRLDRLAFWLWWDGFAVDLAVIRDVLADDARTLDDEIRQARSGDAQRDASAKPRRGMARASQLALSTIVGSQPWPAEPGPAVINWDMGSGPPSLDDLGALMGRLIAAEIGGSRSLETLVTDAADEELARARDRARTVLSVMRVTLAPMAWLYGRRASAFKTMNRILSGLSPTDCAGLVTAMLIIAPHVSAEVLASMDTGVEPALATELQQILAIRDRVPGAAQVITPKVIRAFLHGSDSVRFYMPTIEKFAADHRREIDSVLASFGTGPDALE